MASSFRRAGTSSETTAASSLAQQQHTSRNHHRSKAGGSTMTTQNMMMEEDDSNDDDDSSILTEQPSTWISWFCNLRGNEFFCEVDEDFIEDGFNLTGLANQVPYYEYALDTILDMEPPGTLGEDELEIVDSSAELLYGLIHARYIITTRGLKAMREKFEALDFGRCHRVYCEGQAVLPMGLSDVPRQRTVNLFCPRCNDIYYPKSSRQGDIDGAFFGTTFPHLFFMQFPGLRPSPPQHVYRPRVFGFKIYRGQLEEDKTSENKEAEAKADGRPHSESVRLMPAFPEIEEGQGAKNMSKGGDTVDRTNNAGAGYAAAHNNAAVSSREPISSPNSRQSNLSRNANSAESINADFNSKAKVSASKEK